MRGRRFVTTQNHSLVRGQPRWPALLLGLALLATLAWGATLCWLALGLIL
jgi:hypothetical protein